jgi:pimeloyl-ACP methyl ester carboxylesterase
MKKLHVLLAASLALAACGDDGPSGPVDEGDPPAAGCADGTLESGALYRVCFPADWNGDLVLYAHGYVRPDQPPALPPDVVAGVTISSTINALGYAFATTSYRANGLVADVAVDDLSELGETITARYRPDPSRTFIVGASEGGLVATLALEQEPDRYAGALAACGPIGDFALQIDWIGDFRTVFNYFFPGVVPGNAAESPAEVQANWESVYVPAVIAALEDDPPATAQLLSVTDAPVDFADPETIGETVVGLLWYTVFPTEDAQVRLGGQPYDNSSREYGGSGDDAALNAGVERFTADLTAREALGRFETSGMLAKPLVTLHTDGDPIVPIVHQGLYQAKVEAAGAEPLLDTRPVSRYGHCAFQAGELVSAFSALVTAATP